MAISKYPFAILDVFTQDRFGGNPLAVITDARGLSSEQMQSITREFGFSETTFVLPASDPTSFRKVRIFTPASEIPFAGHPNVGTAFALALDIDGAEPARVRELGTIVFDELAGTVPVSIRFDNQMPVYAELRAPGTFEMIQTLAIEDVANALHIASSSISTERHSPAIATVGMPFLCVELVDLQALGAASTTAEACNALLADTQASGIMLYATTNASEGTLRARMFAPAMGVPEDPATGAACGALAGLLAHIDSSPQSTQHLRIEQGVEMGRPSLIQTRAIRSNGAVSEVYVGGASVLFASGYMQCE